MALRETPDGWAEIPPPDCENCDLAWPFDGTPDRVLVGYEFGVRTFQCCGCGHITRVRPPIDTGGM